MKILLNCYSLFSYSLSYLFSYFFSFLFSYSTALL
nr:MAG TPA: hypothetical protein [Caudoviricetes sp.]